MKNKHRFNYKLKLFHIQEFATETQYIPVNYLHYFLFTPAIKNLGSDEQRKEWLPKALKYEIAGCYAQTELGHGSNVQGIETTATFDKESDSFILHTPRITSYKFWPGELGVFSTHAVVFARLILEMGDLGPHAFIVPIRDLVTLEPFEGVEVGDIGPKFGYNNKDNGFMSFSNYKIPRANMLCRYTSVDETGQYNIMDDPKLIYAVLLEGRIDMFKISPFNLAKGLTIAIRYGLVRTQFKDYKFAFTGPQV